MSNGWWTRHTQLLKETEEAWAKRTRLFHEIGTRPGAKEDHDAAHTHAIEMHEKLREDWDNRPQPI